MANDFRSARFWAAEILAGALYEGAYAVDATAGNGHDTQWLCERVGAAGHVVAFDLQRDAIERTRARLEAAGLAGRATLIVDGHERMADYVPEKTADAIMFNLGWLPGAPHGVTTRVETTLAAIGTALARLKPDGVMTVCVYPGHAEGAREREAVLQWARALEPRKYDAMLKCYLNAVNDPPLMLAVKRNRLKGEENNE